MDSKRIIIITIIEFDRRKKSERKRKGKIDYWCVLRGSFDDHEASGFNQLTIQILHLKGKIPWCRGRHRNFFGLIVI